MTEIEQLAKQTWDRRLAYKNLEAKHHNMLHFAFQSGMWRADTLTISFLMAFQDVDIIVMADIYGVPRQVDPKALLALCKEKYQFMANSWADEYTELGKIRKASDV